VRIFTSLPTAASINKVVARKDHGRKTWLDISEQNEVWYTRRNETNFLKNDNNSNPPKIPIFNTFSNNSISSLVSDKLVEYPNITPNNIIINNNHNRSPNYQCKPLTPLFSKNNSRKLDYSMGYDLKGVRQPSPSNILQHRDNSLLKIRIMLTIRMLTWAHSPRFFVLTGRRGKIRQTQKKLARNFSFFVHHLMP